MLVLSGRWLSGERLMVWWHLTEGPGDQTAQSRGGQREPQPGPGAGLAGTGGKGQQVLAGVLTSHQRLQTGLMCPFPGTPGGRHSHTQTPGGLRSCAAHPAAESTSLQLFCRRALGAASHLIRTLSTWDPSRETPPRVPQVPALQDTSRETPPREPLLPGSRTLLGRPRPACPLVLVSGTLLGRPCPACPLIRGSRTLLRKPCPACPLVSGSEALLGRPRPTCPLVLGSGTLLRRPCHACPLVLGSGSH